MAPTAKSSKQWLQKIVPHRLLGLRKLLPPQRRKALGLPSPRLLLSQGLQDISPTSTKEPGRIAEILQRSQLNSHAGDERTKETKEKTPPSPARCTNWYALEVRIRVEVRPGVYVAPEDDSYSADFVVDTLNLAYPGCTRVFLAEPGSVIAFYGKKGSP